jgi:superfamily II RNA helicase
LAADLSWDPEEDFDRPPKSNKYSGKGKKSSAKAKKSAPKGKKAAGQKGESTRFTRGPKTPGRPKAGKYPQKAHGPEAGEREEEQLYVNKEVKGLLRQIGVPEPKPFEPDPFQVLAVATVATNDTIVSAPTGSGKTWIAKRAIERELALGGKSWYASPLKALSNSKFLEFGREFGSQNVGLLTGDHKINLDAPIIVGTTEILRNQLYDSLVGLSHIDCNLVVLDEAHYLGDFERGMVWEEVLIYMPERVRFLLLSATINNADQLASWLTFLKQTPVKVINGTDRPVPLEPLVLDYQNLSTLDLYLKNQPGKKNNLADYPYARGGHRRLYRLPHYPRLTRGEPGLCLNYLDHHDLLPAIFFLKSRNSCDQAATMAGRPLGEDETADERNAFIDSFIGEYPSLEGYKPVSQLRKKGVASHHAGHLPQFKMLVEELMSRNMLRAIFSTSTVAAGVNFPARSVIVSESSRFNGESFDDLTATELLQMTGRAGRRGMDNIGFAIMVPGPFMDIKLMGALFKSEPDPVRSSLKINFTMVLNLLNAFEPETVKELLSKSLLAWQIADSKNSTNLTEASKSLWRAFQKHQAFLTSLGLLDQGGHLTKDGLMAARLRLDHPLLIYSAIKKGAMPGDPANLAAVLASISDFRSNDEYLDKSSLKKDKELLKDLSTFYKSVEPMNQALAENSFPYLEKKFFLAAKAIKLWASGRSWAESVHTYDRDHGDLVRLITLVSERLNQLKALTELETLSETADAARKLIYRDPVI